MVDEPSPHTRTPNAKSDKLFEIILSFRTGTMGTGMETRIKPVAAVYDRRGGRNGKKRRSQSAATKTANIFGHREGRKPRETNPAP